ncbi:MAG: efflux RND transporter periplasmic adaptor subunit [Tepidisphaeraceae bacterium]
MNLIALPSSIVARRGKIVWIAAPLFAALLAMGAWWAMRGGVGATNAGATPPSMSVVVAPMNLDVTLVKDGELAAVNNIDVYCMVEGQTTVVQIVKEGVSVKKGQTIAVLDSFIIRQKVDDTTLELQKAEADLTTSQEMKEIQDLTNAANLEGAESSLILAQLDQRQYLEGTYPQQVKDAETTLETSKTTLANKNDELAQYRNLFAKGFVNSADVKKAEQEVITAKNGLSKAETALTVLTEYTHKMDAANKSNALSQAEQRLVRVKRENASNLAQKRADLEAKRQARALKQRQLDKLKEQLALCTIKAPADGMVLYSTSGDRNAQNALQEGATVRERQLLFRLPDTGAMKAVVRVPESQVSKLEIGQRASVKVVGRREPVGATLEKISVLADNSQRWWNPDLKEYPVDLTLDETPEGLKPGIGVQVQVFIDRLDDALAVPLPAIYSAGQDRYVFVGAEKRPVKVAVGQSNDTHVQITQGLSAGDHVALLQNGEGRELLEKAGIKLAPTSRPSDAGPRNGSNGARRNRPAAAAG